MSQVNYDLIVIGGGHAGLTAAICAAEKGCSVCVLEVSPKSLRGGNSRHTRNLRPMHENEFFPMEGRYDFDEYMEDFLRVTQGDTNKALATLTLKHSAYSVQWLQDHGVAFQPPLGGTLHLGRTNAFFLGGGKALINSLFRCAKKLGVETIYDVKDLTLEIPQGRFKSLSYVNDNQPFTMTAKALVAAAGGFEANIEWLSEAWGDVAKNFIIRGTPYNRGDILKQLLTAGAEQVGDAKQCHAVAVDGRAPKFDGGICSRVDCVSLGIVVNRSAKRFYDEGEDFWPKRYAIWGRLVAQQPDQIAYSIIDSQADGLFMPTVFKPVQADTIFDLARLIGLDPEHLEATITAYNKAVRESEFNHQTLDDCHTEGLDIPKSHWARRIDKPPFKAYALRPGITFTYLGVKVNDRAQVLWNDGQPCENIFAAGEIMAGNVLGRGYLAGIGMTIGSVFGRIAGREVADYVYR
ncbi:MAG: FAD-dependent tricarballylate dehydrogenase TcuA [Spongiibacteraceae bacterium]|nr:FAD-dependent tricarballylate dehydrogenase TcuA [Spongiibacteraceae bacterium]